MALRSRQSTVCGKAFGGGASVSIRSLLCASVALNVLGVAVAPAIAQEDGASERNFDTITVTARKKEENLNETPLAISAFSAEDFDARNAISLIDVGKFVPNLSVTQLGIGNLSHAAVFIRGIGLQDHIITTDPGVSIYVDGVYLGRQMGSNLNLSNVERVEVLRGPQGTLYGRNSIGGAVNFITRQPGDEEGMRVNLQAGSRARVRAGAYANTELTEDLAVSADLFFNRRNGIGEFLSLPNEERQVASILELGGRVAAKWSPTDRFSLTIAADGSDNEYGQAPTFLDIADEATFLGALGGFGVTLDSLPSDRDDTFLTDSSLATATTKAFGLSATVEVELNDNFSIKGIGSTRYSEYAGGLDITLAEGVLVFPERGDARQYSGELQLNGAFEGWDFVTGAYFFTETGETVSAPFAFLSPQVNTFALSQTADSYAFYGHVNIDLTDALSLGGGVRYTQDEKEATAAVFALPAAGSTESDAITWDASLSYALSDSLNLYGTVQRGYQTGGFPPRPFGGPAFFIEFDPQFATNYEIGLKGVLANSLQFALTGFYTRYTDLQLQSVFVDPMGFNTAIENAGRSRSYGIELDADWIVSDNFRIQGSFGWIDAEFTEIGPNVTATVVGNEPALTPSITATVGPELTFPLADGSQITARADYSYRGEMFGEPHNFPTVLIDDRSLVSFNVRYTAADGSWAVAIYGDNIFNEIYSQSDLDVGFLGYSQETLSYDRSEFGVKFTKNFGL